MYQCGISYYPPYLINDSVVCSTSQRGASESYITLEKGLAAARCVSSALASLEATLAQTCGAPHLEERNGLGGSVSAVGQFSILRDIRVEFASIDNVRTDDDLLGCMRVPWSSARRVCIPLVVLFFGPEPLPWDV